jgi:hypothetical protein
VGCCKQRPTGAIPAAITQLPWQLVILKIRDHIVSKHAVAPRWFSSGVLCFVLHG